MAKKEKKVTKKLKLVFPVKYKRTPILFRLSSDFGVEFNIIEGRFSEEEAWVIATFAGKTKNIKEALDFLANNKIEVKELAENES
jgi:ABC-type methionine transport system ATPase subunit